MLLLLTGDAVSARKIMEILVAEVPQASYMFSPLIQWESRLMGCDAVKAQYSEIGVDDAVLTLSDWNERIGTDMIKSLQSDDDVSPEVCDAREKLSITFMSTMGYIICADAIAISKAGHAGFGAFHAAAGQPEGESAGIVAGFILAVAGHEAHPGDGRFAAACAPVDDGRVAHWAEADGLS